MFGNVQIAPSILSADFLNLERDIHLIEQGECDWIHVDVMDGHFVPNLTIGPPHVKALKRVAGKPLDVHLMIDNPDDQLGWYLEAGADSITVHIETLSDPARTLGAIRDAGCKCAVSLNPPTPTSVVEPYLELVDMVLVMSVNPGFSGQSFIAGSVDKVAHIAQVADERGLCPLIEVDGGINTQTAALVAAAGADVLVAGNAVFKAPDPARAISEIRDAASRARE